MGDDTSKYADAGGEGGESIWDGRDGGRDSGLGGNGETSRSSGEVNRLNWFEASAPLIHTEIDSRNTASIKNMMNSNINTIWLQPNGALGRLCH